MNAKLSDYHATSTDWRQVIRQNQRRSYFVIGTFVLIYLCLGLLLDTFYYSGHYTHAPLSQIFFALITFKLIPYATFLTLFIAIVSLLITFSLHDKLMLLGSEYHEVTSESTSLEEQQLYHVIEEMTVAAGLRYMPKVYIIEADYMNAFATGYSEKSAMVAITRGLMLKLNRAELQAVMAHELSHIRHLDIKLTLLAVVLSNLLLILIDVLFYSMIFGRRRDEEGGGNGLAIVIIILRYLLPIITILLMLFLSRSREYMADAGCVELMRDNQPLANALLKIENDHLSHRDDYAAAYQQTPHEAIRREAYIFDPISAGIEPASAWSDFMSTHPSLEKRLAALGFKSR